MWDWVKKTASQAYNNYVKPAVNWVNSKVVQPTVKAVQNVTKSVSQPRNNNNRSRPSNTPSSTIWGSSNNNTSRQTAEREAAAQKAKTQASISAAQNVWKNYTNSVNTSKPSWSGSKPTVKTNTFGWKGLGNTLVNAWNGAVASKPSQWIANSKVGQWLANDTPINGATNILSRWWESKNIAGNLDKSSDVATSDIDRTRAKRDALITGTEDAPELVGSAKILEDLKNGVINDAQAREQFNALETKFNLTDAKLKAKSKLYIDYFNKSEADLNRAIPWNQKGITPAVSTFWNKYKGLGLKPAWDILAFGVTLPSRVGNTVLNSMVKMIDPDNSKGVKVPTYEGSPAFVPDPKKGQWTNFWNESANQKNPYWHKLSSDLPQDLGVKGDWTQKNGYTKFADVLGDAILDPSIGIKAGTGFKIFDAIVDMTKNSKVGLNVATKWANSNNKVVKAVKWLNLNKGTDPAMDVIKVEKQAVWDKLNVALAERNKYYEKMMGFYRKYKDSDKLKDLKGKDFGLEGLTHAEMEAYQRSIVRSGWRDTDKIVLDPDLKWTRTMSKDKVVRAIYKNRSRWNRMATAEQTKKGLKFDKGLKTGYEPLWRGQGKKGGLEVSDKKPQAWFTKSRESGSVIPGDASKFMKGRSLKNIFRSRLSRQRGHTAAMGIKPYFKEYNEFKQTVVDLKHELEVLDTAENAHKATKGFKINDLLNKLGKYSPTRTIWKPAVLAGRPAWYVNNVAWNVVASFMGGGTDVLGSYKKIVAGMLKEKKLTPGILKDMPEAIRGNTLAADTFGKKLGAPGSWVEGLSRSALYDAMIKKGFSPEEATKQVNRYLFDYGNTKNWERPIQAVVPFWNWQKNIAKFTATMPLNNPVAAHVFKFIKTEYMDKPLEEIPDENQSYVDSESGKTITWNARNGFEGKIKTPWGWTTVPFLPVMPGQLDKIGLSPWLRLSEELLTGKDTFGNSLWSDNTMVDRIAKTIPQISLGYDKVGALNNKDSKESWITPSGYTKSKQGFDPGAKNYDPNLDKEKKYKTNKNSFLGGRNFKQFDKSTYEEKKRYNAFSKEWFSHDFNKEFADTSVLSKDATNAEKNAFYDNRSSLNDKKKVAMNEIATKHGFDLQKDIYDGKWAKFDTTQTTISKNASEDYHNDRSKFFSESSAFWKKYTGETDVSKKIQMLIDQPRYSKKSIEELKISLQKTLAYTRNKPFWIKYWSLSDPVARRALMATRPDLMKKGTSEKAIFWQTYINSDFRTKRRMLREHPERLADIKNRDPKKADMAWAYENLAPYERKKYFASKGYTLDKVMTNKDYADLRKEDQAKKDRDVAFYPTLAANKTAFKSSISSSVKKKVKQGTKVTWSNTKKVIDKPIWKVS